MKSLTKEQQQLAQAINGMQINDRLVVNGRAGSGKTYALAHALEEKKALYLTPTHAARRVLQQELPAGAKAMTIHSAINWRKGLDDDLKWYDFSRPSGNANVSGEPFASADIVIVDEYSMVGAKLFDPIEQMATAHNVSVVYSGDNCQLKPVKDREVITKQGFDTIALTGSLRFPEDSDIFRFGEMLREMILHDPDADLPLHIESSTMGVVSGGEWMRNLTADYQNGIDVLALSSENKPLHRMRRKIRQVDHNGFIPGDRVVSKKTDQKFQNGEQLTISRIEPTQRTVDVPKCVNASGTLSLDVETITFVETSRTAIIATRSSDLDNVAELVRDLHQRGALDRRVAVSLIEWLGEFNNFELAAVATVHKSQGRTVGKVYIDTDTVLQRRHWMSPKDHKRLLYTAITRASDKVVFYERDGLCIKTPANLATATALNTR